MNLFRSQGDPGWGPLLAVAAALWFIPGLVGGVLLEIGKLAVGNPGLADLWVIGAILLASPMFSWMGWALALPAARILLLKGWFGWLPAAATGFVAGLVAGQVIGATVAPWFGLIALVLLRALLPFAARRMTRPAP